jgi:hypothetical protein
MKITARSPTSVSLVVKWDKEVLTILGKM